MDLREAWSYKETLKCLKTGEHHPIWKTDVKSSRGGRHVIMDHNKGKVINNGLLETIENVGELFKFVLVPSFR